MEVRTDVLDTHIIAIGNRLGIQFLDTCAQICMNYALFEAFVRSVGKHNGVIVERDLLLIFFLSTKHVSLCLMTYCSVIR